MRHCFGYSVFQRNEERPSATCRSPSHAAASRIPSPSSSSASHSSTLMSSPYSRLPVSKEYRSFLALSSRSPEEEMGSN